MRYYVSWQLRLNMELGNGSCENSCLLYLLPLSVSNRKYKLSKCSFCSFIPGFPTELGNNIFNRMWADPNILEQLNKPENWVLILLHPTPTLRNSGHSNYSPLSLSLVLSGSPSQCILESKLNSYILVLFKNSFQCYISAVLLQNHLHVPGSRTLAAVLKIIWILGGVRREAWSIVATHNTPFWVQHKRR